MRCRAGCRCGTELIQGTFMSVLANIRYIYGNRMAHEDWREVWCVMTAVILLGCGGSPRGRSDVVPGAGVSSGTSRPVSHLEQYRPQVATRTDTTILIQDDNGNTFPMKVRKVGDALIYQDDMVVTQGPEQSAIGIRKFLRWDDGIIPYIISQDHPHRADILRAIETLNKNTVLWFRPATSFGSDYISIFSGD